MKEHHKVITGQRSGRSAGSRFIQRSSTLAATAAALLVGIANANGEVNGNSTISADVLGRPLTISTYDQFAGAISSMRWGDKEFVNIWDHGRQFQTALSAFNRYECYNVYEAGSKPDGQKPTSSSVLLSLNASGNRLQTETQMAWYTHGREPGPNSGDFCGDPNLWLPCPPYTGPLSDYRLYKTVTIGFAGLSNVIEYPTSLFVPEQVRNSEIQTVVAVMPYDFSTVLSYDIISGTYRKIRSEFGEDDSVKVLSTADGAYAMGYYSPELLQPYGNGSAGGFRWGLVPPDPVNFPNEPDFKCAGFGGIDRSDTIDANTFTSHRSFLVVGDRNQVQSTMRDLHFHFRALDPDVFNWKDYVTINVLQEECPTRAAAEAHWISKGLPQGRTASKTFSAFEYLRLNPDVAGVFGANNYQGAIDHYIASGRNEGRNTVAKPAAGMQHTLVFANKEVRAAGENEDAQLGSPASDRSAVPLPVAELGGTTEIAAGDYTSLAVKNDGTLWVWGSNQYGARGDGSTGGEISSPVQVPLPNAITTPTRGRRNSIANGGFAYAAIDTEGQVWTWGVNWNGRLGDGSGNSTRFHPARVRKSSNPDDYLTGIVSISAGGGTMAAVDADGNVWTWGAGANGALGNGSTEDSAYPVQVVTADGHPLFGVSEVRCGSSGFCVALIRYGAVFAWGNNSFGQLGRAPGGFASVASPVAVGPENSIEDIAVGAAHTIAHSRDGNVYGWGYNGRGQLGTGFPTVAQATPVAMDRGPHGMDFISDLAAGAYFNVMVRNSDRAVFVVGDNQSGQLGLPGNLSPQHVPVRSSY